jgi:RNA polymerase sigma factor (sigma-70 family)
MQVITNERLYQALLREDAEAIRSLKILVYPKIVAYCKKFSVPVESAEEVTHDSMMILMDDMESRKFLYEGKCPSFYAIRVGQYLVLNLSKSKYTRRDKIQDLTGVEHLISAENIEQKLHNTHLINQMLAQLPERCRQLIEIKYLKEYSYDQIIALNLTHYQSVAAVKNATSQCMGKLTEAVKKMGLLD